MNASEEKNNQALIAIVDDDQSFREALASLLRLIGFRTAIFASARNFLDAPQLPNVSCAILDVSMPGMDGLELQRHLVATHPIPIIFVTDVRDAKTREQAVQAGAISFLNKPVSEETLIDALNSALPA
ncbi:response regulator transcription factor [Candidatus Binatus sp.]|jgi:FixJ family two-component response regulator|uniref:response regulator transcription factor n=1 Tax=Candidatus Binatus sp. TaxID=2811406 RepID=UPI003CC5B4F2